MFCTMEFEICLQWFAKLSIAMRDARLHRTSLSSSSLQCICVGAIYVSFQFGSSIFWCVYTPQPLVCVSAFFVLILHVHKWDLSDDDGDADEMRPFSRFRQMALYELNGEVEMTGVTEWVSEKRHKHELACLTSLARARTQHYDILWCTQHRRNKNPSTRRWISLNFLCPFYFALFLLFVRSHHIVHSHLRVHFLGALSTCPRENIVYEHL